MSTTENSLSTEIEEYLKNFPLGRTRDEIEEEFVSREPAEIEEALRELQERDVILHAGGTYRWTG